MKFSIIVLTYNRAEVLQRLLSELNKLEYSHLEIIVIDNNSEDETETVINDSFNNIRYVKMKKNIGTAARNIGFDIATGDVVVTLDDDIVGFKDEHIETIKHIFLTRSEIGGVCFKIVDHRTNQVCNWCHHCRKDIYCDTEFNTDEITEGAVAFRKTAIDCAGQYAPYFFISHEGADLLCRIMDRGYSVIYNPEILVKHLTHPSGRKSWRRYYFDTRNQIWLAARNYPFYYAMKYLSRGLGAMLFYSLRDGFFRYWIQGVTDAMKYLPTVFKERKKIKYSTLTRLKAIAKTRPTLAYTLKQRLFKCEIKL